MVLYIDCTVLGRWLVMYYVYCVSTGIPLDGAVSQAPPSIQQTTPNTALQGSTDGTPSLPGPRNMQGMTSVSLYNSTRKFSCIYSLLQLRTESIPWRKQATTGGSP